MNYKKIFAIGAAAVVAAAIFTGCQKKHTYTTDDYLNVSVDGINGEGKASAAADGAFMDKINNDFFGGSGTDLELARYEIELYDAVEYDFVGDTENLSNGDTVSVVLTADNERLKELGIKFKQDTYTYTVADLPVPTELDVFDKVKVNFEGISPNLKAEINCDECDALIKDNVNFYLDKSRGIKNGENVTLTAYVSQSTLDELNERDSKYYVVKDEEKTFAADGFDEYLCDKADLSALEKEMYLYVQDATSDKKEGNYRVGSTIVGHGIFKDGDYDEYTLKSVTITPVKKLLAYNANSSQKTNCYSVFYKAVFEAERGGKVCKSDNIFIRMDMPNIIRKSDGTLSYDNDNLSLYGYTPSLFSNYVGADFSEVYDDYNLEMTGWDFVLDEDV